MESASQLAWDRVLCVGHEAGCKNYKRKALHSLRSPGHDGTPDAARGRCFRECLDINVQGLTRATALQTDVAIVAERQRMMEEWQEWYQTKEEWLHENQVGLAKLLGERLEEGEYTTEEVTVETVISNIEEVLKT